MRFLNSGFYIGYAEDIIFVVSYIIDVLKLNPKEHDQKYFHYIYTNKTMREEHDIKLDHHAKLVFNICGADGDVQFQCVDGNIRLPCLIIDIRISLS